MAPVPAVVNTCVDYYTCRTLQPDQVVLAVPCKSVGKCSVAIASSFLYTDPKLGTLGGASGEQWRQAEQQYWSSSAACEDPLCRGTHIDRHSARRACGGAAAGCAAGGAAACGPTTQPGSCDGCCGACGGALAAACGPATAGPLPPTTSAVTGVALGLAPPGADAAADPVRVPRPSSGLSCAGELEAGAPGFSPTATTPRGRYCTTGPFWTPSACAPWFGSPAAPCGD